MAFRLPRPLGNHGKKPVSLSQVLMYETFVGGDAGRLAAVVVDVHAEGYNGIVTFVRIAPLRPNFSKTQQIVKSSVARAHGRDRFVVTTVHCQSDGAAHEFGWHSGL